MSRSDIPRLILLGAAIIALLLLAMTLSHLTMESGVPFAEIWAFLVAQLRSDGIAGPLPLATASSEGFTQFLRTLFTIVLLAFPFAVILVLVDPAMRKRVLKALLRLAIIFALLGWFIDRQMEREEETLEGVPTGQLGGELAEVAPFTEEEFSADRVSKYVVWGLSLLVGLALAGIAVATANRVRRGRAGSAEPWTKLADQVQAAIREIQAGADLRSSILRCYAEMMRIVRDSRGVQRTATMTAREFREYMVRAGLPAGPVGRLTELFERARYSADESTPQEERDAVASLSAIADACRSLV